MDHTFLLLYIYLYFFISINVWYGEYINKLKFNINNMNVYIYI
jgi:hypothetical protein